MDERVGLRAVVVVVGVRLTLAVIWLAMLSHEPRSNQIRLDHLVMVEPRTAVNDDDSEMGYVSEVHTPQFWKYLNLEPSKGKSSDRNTCVGTSNCEKQ